MATSWTRWERINNSADGTSLCRCALNNHRQFDTAAITAKGVGVLLDHAIVAIAGIPGCESAGSSKSRSFALPQNASIRQNWPHETTEKQRFISSDVCSQGACPRPRRGNR